MPKKKSGYDVFISYSHNDSDWVRGYLLPMLDSWGLKVAIDNKVFIPGETLDVHIQQTIDQSEHVIFVCTQHFMASSWCLLEVEKTLARKTIHCIPLVLDGAKHVPESLGNITWADLTDLQHDENEWKKLCASLNGAWSEQSSAVLADLQDLASFFGGFMNNKTPTYVIQRSHNVIHDGQDVDHMITMESIDAISVVHILLGRIQKTKKVQIVLTNDNSERSMDLGTGTSGNYIVLGGSLPELVSQYSGRDFDKFYWKDQLPLDDGKFKKVDWETDGWGFLIYKARTTVDDMVIFLYSPSGEGTKMAAEKLLDQYWEMARAKKGREFVQAYDYEGKLLFEHIYHDR